MELLTTNHFRGSNPDNMCFSDKSARGILLWDPASIEFVKDYLSVFCSEFDPPEDPIWRKKKKNLLIQHKSKNPSISDMTVGEIAGGIRWVFGFRIYFFGFFC